MRKTQLGWGLQLSVLCLMLSTPFWLREDIPVFEPVLKSLSNSDADESTLKASGVLVLDFAKLDSESVIQVTSRQLRLASTAYVATSSKSVRIPASSKFRSRVIKETWQLHKVERVFPRAPASDSREWIKVHAPDEESRVSEYFEIGREPCELILHFGSSSQKTIQKKVSLRYKSGDT
jgi:hypothetical protein